MSYAADDYEAIRRREEEIKAERNLILTGTAVPAEEPKEQPSWASYMIGHDYDPA